LSVKIVLLGDSGVGKSSLVLRYVRDTFHPFQEPTIGAAFVAASEAVEDEDRNVELKIWDTAGQERYHSLTPLYFRGAHIAVLAFDVCRTHSFRALHEWARQVQSYNSQILLAVVGTKSDLSEHRSVSTQEAKDFSSTVRAVLYMETSAKENVMVKELFQQVARRALQMIPVQSLSSGGGGGGLGGRMELSSAAGITSRPTVDLSATAPYGTSSTSTCCGST
jgi:small GTP-binding protein